MDSFEITFSNGGTRTVECHRFEDMVDGKWIDFTKGTGAHRTVVLRLPASLVKQIELVGSKPNG